MTEHDWSEFLSRWSKDALSSVFAAELPSEVLESGCLSFPGATDDQITSAEVRLGTRFPPSYRAFLARSNGFWLAGLPVPRLYSATEVEWFAARDPETVRIWVEQTAVHRQVPPVTDEEYYVYGDQQDPVAFRPAYLKHALQVSERERAGTAVLLLNPKVVSAEGEWEAWLFAHWLAGASRYRSFWDLMQAEYQSFLSLGRHEQVRLQRSEDLAILPAKLAGLIQEFENRIQEWVRVDERRKAVSVSAEEGYHRGIIEGLRFGQTCVRQIQADAQSAQVVYQRLHALADDLESKWQQSTRAVRGASILALVLSGGVGKVTQKAGAGEGYREASAIVRWFLNER